MPKNNERVCSEIFDYAYRRKIQLTRTGGYANVGDLYSQIIQEIEEKFYFLEKVVDWKTAVRIHKLFYPNQTNPDPANVKISYDSNTWERIDRRNKPNYISNAGVGNSNHHVIPEGEMQGIFSLLCQHFGVNESDCDDPPLRNAVIKLCHPGGYNATGQFRVTYLNSTQFAWTPCNLFRGPDGNHRVDDPRSGMEERRPENFPEFTWMCLMNLYKAFEKCKNQKGSGKKSLSALRDAVINLAKHAGRHEDSMIGAFDAVEVPVYVDKGNGKKKLQFDVKYKVKSSDL